MEAGNDNELNRRLFRRERWASGYVRLLVDDRSQAKGTMAIAVKSSRHEFWENGMLGSENGFYRSSNGDQWDLVREPGSEALSVRHRPNKASGGASSTMSIDEFLSEGHGPQHEALMRVLESKKER